MSRVIGRRLHATCCNGATQTPETPILDGDDTFIVPATRMPNPVPIGPTMPEENLCRPVVVPGKNRKRSKRLFIVSIKPNGQCGLKPRIATSSNGIGVDLCRRDR